MKLTYRAKKCLYGLYKVKRKSYMPFKYFFSCLALLKNLYLSFITILFHFLQPLALVAWGCRLLMSQVNPMEVIDFIKKKGESPFKHYEITISSLRLFSETIISLSSFSPLANWVYLEQRSTTEPQW